MSHSDEPDDPNEIAARMFGAILSDVRRARINLDHAHTTATQQDWHDIAAALARESRAVGALLETIAATPPRDGGTR